MTWLFLLKDHFELFKVFTIFFNEIKTQFGITIKQFRSDNAKEYISSEFQLFLSTHGIIHQTSCPYTPQQNGVAERKNQHLLNTARSLMFEMKVPKFYWSFAVLTACFLINRMPSHVLNNVSPFSLVFPRREAFPIPPRVFGCTCFVQVLGPGNDKLDPRAIVCFSVIPDSQKDIFAILPILRKCLLQLMCRFLKINLSLV